MERTYSAKKLLVRAKTQVKKQEKRQAIRQDKRLVKRQAKQVAGTPVLESSTQK